MNILIINMYYYPNVVGGTENSIKLLAEGLVSKGHRSVVYTLDGKSDKLFRMPENINNVLIYRGYSRSVYERWKHNKKTFNSVLNNRIHFFYNRHAVSDIAQIVQNERIDIIHTNNLGSISLGVWKWAWKNNISLVHTVRDYWLIDPSTVIGRSNLLLGIVHRLMCKCFANRYVKFVTAPSKRTLELLQKHNLFKYANLRCIANCIIFEEDVLYSAITEKSIRPSNNIRFLFVGNLLENKGIRILLDAFEKVENKTISLTICGSGPEKKLVEQRVEQDRRIKYKGQCTSEQVKAEYSNADVLIVPSKWDEPFGRIIIEGAQYGLPVIGSNRGGIPEIISTLKCGRLYDADSVQDLAELIKCFTSRTTINYYMRNIPQKIDYYSIEKQIDNFTSLYYEIMTALPENLNK